MRCGPRWTPTGCDDPALMIIPDVNVLVYAYRREAELHDRYAGWLNRIVAGADELALPETVLTGFVRIVTNPRILATPAPTDDALGFVEVLRSGSRAHPCPATDTTWSRFSTLVAADRQIRGNLVPDAWIAALAASHGGTVATADRGFARFGVPWFDPAVDLPGQRNG
ncbi:TA system VapC family ribonuclease toxin [Pseudonocardia sp. CA-107938]|uniref:TA system VapC family ribonuclease toxin n=1 Tax=Pseudonocardia sp. CA-107938 TaxID=3240021 RepID=UPI003D8E8635